MTIDKELRYQIIGMVFGRLIMVIAVPLGSSRLKVFSAKASEYNEIYDIKAK